MYTAYDIRVPTALVGDITMRIIDKATAYHHPTTGGQSNSTTDYQFTVHWEDKEGWTHTCWIDFDVYGSPMTQRITVSACDFGHSGNNECSLRDIRDAVMGTLQIKASEIR